MCIRPLQVGTEVPNECWMREYVLGQLTDGFRFRILAVFGVCTLECMGLIADSCLLDRRIIREPNKNIADGGKAKMGISNGNMISPPSQSSIDPRRNM